MDATAGLSSLLLAAGACISQNGSFSGRCALQPAECGVTETYTSSFRLALDYPDIATICSDQAHIHTIPALGRCDSASERFICTSHKSACIHDVAFRESDPDCTVLEDFRPVDTKFVRSYYGECIPTDDGEAQGFESYGAWQFTECPKGGIYRFYTADKFFANRVPQVQCDRVKTGACVSDSDPGQFFCAVSKEVCEAEEGFSYQKSYELGTTCKLCDTIPPPPDTKYAKAGACIVPSINKFVRCALIPEHCDGLGEEFFDPISLMSESFGLAEAAACLDQRGLHQVRVGRCEGSGDLNVCTSDKTSCRNTYSFKPNDESCLLLEDLDVTGDESYFATTHFGHCSSGEDSLYQGYQEGRENYCAWGFTECKPATTDVNARPLLFSVAVPGTSETYPTCYCDDVRTGACVSETDPNDMYCAVAASACTQSYTYNNVRTLELASGSNTICYLCRELGDIPTLPPKPTQPPIALSSPPAISPVSSPVRVVPVPVPQPNSADGKLRPSTGTQSVNKITSGAIVGIAVGSVLFIALGVLLIHCCYPSTPAPQEIGLPHDEVQKEDAKAVPEDAFKNKPMEAGQTQEDFVPQEDHSVN